MELATIKMDRNVARRAFLDYRRAVRERHNDEDAQIMRGYRALAQGKQLIHLRDTIKAGGVDVKTYRGGRGGEIVFHVPRLAACRADAKMCYTNGITRRGEVVLTADRKLRELGHNNIKDRTNLPAGTFGEGTSDGWSWAPCLKAIVPNVPPPLRPAHSLSGYTILWEATWSIDPPPPGDPALLKHVGGELYAVVAVWDLTELEQAVLAGRS